MKISKKAQYGLRAMIYLAKNSAKDKVCSLKEVSEKEKIPFDFLEKIIKDLQAIGLIKAKKGVLGGYYLSKKPEKIYVGQIIETLEDIVPVECAGCQMARACSSKGIWDELKDSLSDTLYSKTLKDLIK